MKKIFSDTNNGFTFGSTFHYMMKLNTVIFLICLLFPYSTYADLSPLNEDQMKKATGQQGITDYSVTGNIARMFVDIHIETAGQISSLKAGLGQGRTDITNIQIASDENPLEIDGFVVLTDFDNIYSKNRKLQKLVIGTNRVQGTISGDVKAFTGVYNDALTGGASVPVYGNSTALGQTTFNFDSNASETENMGMFMVFTAEGANPGINFVAGFDEESIQKAVPAGEWWESP